MVGIRSLTSSLCLVALFVPLVASADDYRAEVDLTLVRIDVDDAPDIDVARVAGTYYFAPVPTDGVPLAEAAFLNRSSFVGAGAQRTQFDDFDADSFGAGIGYYLPGTIFYGELDYTYFDSGDESYFSGALGVAPIDGLLVTTRFDEDGWDPNATARYVGKLPNTHFYAASVEVYEDGDDDFEFAANFDYYFDETFSAGAGVSEHSTILRARKFFSPSFSLGAEVEFGDDDANAYAATLSWRF